jgi:hypothetical protein
MTARLGVTPVDMHGRSLDPEGTTLAATALDRSSWPRSPRAWLATWAKNFGDQYAVAVAYDALSHLSDTALKHRGLSRDILARDVRQRSDRAVGD